MKLRFFSQLCRSGRHVAFGGRFSRFASSQQSGQISNTNENHYKIVVVGGGAGGLSTASRLCPEIGGDHLAVIEPSDVHYYQPLWTLVGGGLREFKDSCRPMKDVIRNDVVWIKDKVESFDPVKNSVTVSSGNSITYDILIVAMGIQLDFGRIKGLPEAFESPGVCSNYCPMTVEKTASAIKNFKKGNAVFTQPVNPIKCGGAPQKIMYLVDEYLKQNSNIHDFKVCFYTALPVMFTAPIYADVLKTVAENKDISLNFEHNLVEVKPESKMAVFQKNDGSLIEVEFEMIHITPPMVAPKPIQESVLSDPTGFLDVNKETLQHNNFYNIFGIGDCTNIPTSKTAAAVAGQSGVLYNNVLRLIQGKPLKAEYDGYTSCPLVTGFNKGILAEFDFDLKPLETLPINQAKERYLSYLIKADVLPRLYWQLFLKGRWEGPKNLRKIFHLGFSR